MSLTIQQKIERRQGIGGSDVAAILGISKWKTALDIYLEKLSVEEPYEEQNNPFTKWGHKLEPLIVKQFEEVTGNKCLVIKEQFKHPEHKFMLANIDAKLESQNALLECKAVFNWQAAKEWGEPGSDNIPEAYLIQCAHYAEVLDADCVYIAVLMFGHDFRIYKYNRNHKLGNMLIEKERYFWNECVLKEVPPVAISIDDAIKLYGSMSDGSCKIADNEIISTIRDLKIIKQKMDDLKNIQDIKTKEVFSYMQQSEYLNDESGNNLATWNMQKYSSFNRNKLKEDNPDLYNQYLKTTNNRVFRLKK